MLTQPSLETLYGQGMSMADISKHLHCSVHKVVYWMDKYHIPKRSHSEATYQKQNPHGDPFSIKTTRTPKEQLLYGLALGLYWGEGTKSNSSRYVRLTNTDASMIRTFRDFLFTLCNVSSSKIHYSLVTFNDTNPKDAALYWAKELGTSVNSFGTIVSIPPQGKGSYKRKSQHGVCSITVGNVKLKHWILHEIETIAHLPG